jgi:acyl-coenzyme A synthetase/AMP-(fatty) acid ligase
MTTPLNRSDSLWRRICTAPSLRRSISDECHAFCVGELTQKSAFGRHLTDFAHASVLIACRRQLNAVITLIELDGLAQRLVICPPDLARENFPFIIDRANVTHIVHDGDALGIETRALHAAKVSGCSFREFSGSRTVHTASEWVLFTSGSTGRPKMVVHSLQSLAGPTESAAAPSADMVWSTFYDIRRYGGMQILLRALSAARPLMLSSPSEPVMDFLKRAATAGVTHISGTPSHWRRVLLSRAAAVIQPRYVRLSGEPSDQAILDRLQETYSQARIVHAFASTEAGVAFEVTDGLAGFPAAYLTNQNGSVQMRVQNGTLRIRSPRTASRYLDRPGIPLEDADGFVDTHDVLQLCNDRYFFMGRQDGILNIGGLKVHPEEIEASINRHPAVLIVLVAARPNPIIGSLITAQVVLRDDFSPATVVDEILEQCRRTLPPHKVPASIKVVPSLDLLPSGKLSRCHA